MARLAIEDLFRLAVAFLVLGLLFWAIERLWPSLPGQRRLRKGWRTDAWYFVFTPLVTHNMGRLILALTVVLIFWILGLPIDRNLLHRGWGPVASLSLPIQTALALVLGDFIGYWTHRLLHGGLWPVHAVHHSSEEMDWMSTLRLHPLNDFLGRLLRGVPFVMLGFSPLVLALLLPLLGFHAFLLHANVDWSFGPFRFVLASPVFHRWHHSAHSISRGKNFAGLFPLWDLLFGTFHMPPTQRAQRFGAPGARVPDAFWGQVLYPLQTSRRRAQAELSKHSLLHTDSD